MYVVGHCITALEAGVLSAGELPGQALLLMLPDIARCHDWGYAQCGRPAPARGDRALRLVRAHLLGDWYVHFGATLAASPRKVGWAYRRMRAFSPLYRPFFQRARERGLCRTPRPPDSIRGFSHTMVEYAIDTYLADRGALDPWFAAVQAALSRVGALHGPGSAAGIAALLARWSAGYARRALDDNARSFGARAARARSPQELAFRAGVKKFGLRDCDEAIAHVEAFLRHGMAGIPAVDFQHVVADTTAFIARHLQAEGEKGAPSWT